MAFTDYKDLDVWKVSIDLTCETYNLIKRLPKEEQYSLADQMRRAVVSIPSNIAEGRGRQSDTEFAHYLYIAKGSCYELETQIIICEKLNYLNENECERVFELTNKVSRMLANLIKTLKR